MRIYPTGDQRSEAAKARDKKNRGIRGHPGGPNHHTTDPFKHYQLTLKTIRKYREGAQKRAKNTVSKAAPLTPERNARSGEEDLQGSHGKSG